MPGQIFQGEIYQYAVVDANGAVVNGNYWVSENITPVSGNAGPDIGTSGTSQGPLFSDWVGFPSGPDGQFQSGTVQSVQLQTFSVTFSNGISYTLSTAVTQSVTMQDGVVTSATATVTNP